MLRAKSCYAQVRVPLASSRNHYQYYQLNNRRHYASHIASPRSVIRNLKPGNLAGVKRQAKEEPTVNEVGIQYLSRQLQRQMFPLAVPSAAANTTFKKKQQATKELAQKASRFDKEKINLSQRYLGKFSLLNKKTNIIDPISFNMPPLQGKTLNEHFIRLALNDSARYVNFASLLSKHGLPPRPKQWLMEPGWYRYDPNSAEPVKVPYPLEDMLVFDVETMYKVSQYPVMATCASPVAWYGWVSPYLTDPHASEENDNHLIPMNTHGNAKLIVGHNVSYDRARIKDEYNFQRSKAFFLDTLSLHVASKGICSRQRPLWTKFNANQKIKTELNSEVTKLLDEKNFYEYLLSDQLRMLGNDKVLDKFEDGEDNATENPWVAMTSTNSLADVAALHCNIRLNKIDRDYFKSTDKSLIVENFQKLMNYCAGDVFATHKIFQKLYGSFLDTCPHPVSFSALRHINSIFLPTSYKTWKNYIQNAESLYQNNKVEIEKQLAEMALELVEKFKKHPEEILADPWYSQLNWEVKPIKLTKSGKPYKRQKMPGFPEWYKSLFPTSDGEIKLSIRTRLVPLLLKLKWEGLPLVWTETKGWCFKIKSNQFTQINELVRSKNYVRIDDFTSDPNFETLTKDYEFVYFKVPHPSGDAQRTTTLTSKNFLKYYEKKVMSSEYEIAEKVLELNAAASYWISSRERIMNQFVVYESKGDTPENNLDFNLPLLSKGEADNQVGMIIPQILPMGTITRRAVENTWLTASNVKKNRIGSELKTKIEAPDGYCFVGADVDSEELWIASLLSDSVFKLHGGSAIGWMTLEGNKLEKTDLHSKTAEILGISRNEAKIFNYSRIYGAGLKHTSSLLKQFNPNLTEKEIIKICNNLFDNTKGKILKLTNKEKAFFNQKSINLNKIWYGGSESILFNKLENVAETSIPKTPVLKAGITAALKKENLNSNTFLPSRINWAIQSSGVDYLHLLIISMEYLINMYGIDARLCITVHDEIRYLVKEEDKYKAALLLQIANLWTRGIFCEQLGINDIPQSCAFFSQVDIDKILRKEVDTLCETPSNQNVQIPNGETLDIQTLLEKMGMEDGVVPWLAEGKDINLNQFKVDSVLTKLSSAPVNNGATPIPKEIVKAGVTKESAIKENATANKITSASKSAPATGSGVLSDTQETLFINMQIEQDIHKVRSLLKKLMLSG